MPFYNKEFPLSKKALIGFIIVFIIPFVLAFGNIKTYIPFGCILLISGLLAIGIASKGNFKSICKKVHKSDIKLIVVLIILEAIFSISVSMIELLAFGIHSNPNPVFGSSKSVLLYIELIFDLFGEELFKLIGIFLFTYIFYKISKNRKLSIILAAFITLSCFGLLHAPEYGNVFHALVSIGYASVFTVYAYIKTKNIFVSYLIHLIFDYVFIILGTVLAGLV
ncbi:MAG: hypothetical protein Q4Q23_08225 [Methanobacteriaceae archaeon]|nr:hypothetical protein [Methanobacteriaceae archaeon]